MPIVLQPLPRRIHRTHVNLSLGGRVYLSAPPDTDPAVTEELEQILEPLFPQIRPIEAATEEETTAVSLRLFDTSETVLQEVPADVVDQSYQLTVGSGGIEIAAGSATGWLLAARQLAGLRAGEELTGIELLDWPSFPVRGIDLPWPASTVSPGAFETLLHLLGLCRMNQLGLPGEQNELPLPEALSETAARFGVRVIPTGQDPSFRLIERPSLFPRYTSLLPRLQAAAAAAEEEGRRELFVSLGDLDSQTALEALAYGILFAGDCAWNPRKADLKAFRRTYALRRFSLDSRAPALVNDTLEEGAALAASAEGVDLGDPFDPTSTIALSLPEEPAARLVQKGVAAMTAMGPLQPDSEERAIALQGLQWTAQRLKRLGSLLGTADRVRELYRSAYVAAASPKAVSDRLLRAADLLESEARALDEHRGEWHALWRRERREPYDPGTEAALRAPGEALLARAARLRDLRSRYIQTGSLPSPADEGLERTQARLTAGIIPSRLPPQPSPAWWPEGGAARVRVEVECPEPAAGMPWAVQADFRALAGEAGAFHVRSARLIPLTESDAAGPEQPCQLMRAGFAFIPQPASGSYFLYLDPEPTADSGFREVRASQSRSAVRLENRRMRVSFSPSRGFVSEWHLFDPNQDLLADSPDSAGTAVDPPGEWRLRVVETGPLLARVRCEHPDGRVRQLDLGAGQSWIDVSANSTGDEFFLPLRRGLWSGEVEWISGTKTGTQRRRPGTPRSEGDGVAAEEALWATLHSAGGLTIGVVLPEGAAAMDLTEEALRLRSPGGGHCLWFAGREEDPIGPLARLAEAWQRPPRVRLGIFEHRRVREF